MKFQSQRRGFALVVVLVILTLVVVYVVAVTGSVETTLRQMQIEEGHQARAEAAASILAGTSVGDSASTSTLNAPAEFTFDFVASGLITPAQVRTVTARVQQRPLTDGDPLWERFKALRPLEGDVLVSIVFDHPGAIAELYLVNRMGRRQGAVALGASS